MSRFAAIVLAGDRRADDPLALASGHGCKALLEIAGRPMVLRVLDALAGSTAIDAIHLSGPAESSVAGSEALRRRLAQGDVTWHAPGPSPSTSAFGVLSGMAAGTPVLLTTADHPLLRAEYIDYFCRAARASGADAVVGLAPYARVQEIFPTMRKTLLRFSEEPFCGCNLFAFLTPAGRAMAERWRQVEAARKTPWRVIGLIGWGAVLRYRAGLLSLDAAMQLLSRRSGLKVRAIRLPFGEAAVDVDSLEDHALVEVRLQARGP